jgi:phosphotransferase system enzyme I (PtsI)
VDFFSIGTNDLIQYLLAVDRANEQVAHLYRPEHPSVLKLLKIIIDISKGNNVPISMCGEMAGDPLFVSFLLGLGLRNFSVSPPQLPEVKRIIRNTSLGEARDIAAGALEFSSLRDVRNYLRNKTSKRT